MTGFTRSQAVTAYFKKRARQILLVPFFVFPLFVSSCAITATRPAQEMSNMEVAIRAAKEVNADVLAPELFRMAQETSLKARRDYRLKNFQAAKEFADQARTFAERSEFESIRNGGKRDIVPQDPLAEPSYPVEPIAPGNHAAPSPAAGAPATPPSPR
jgi:hypothetical protein